MKLWSWQKENLPSIRHSVRTALAATASVIVARLVQMPEAYWAAIATLVVMQSSLGATLTLSIERVVATALGASVGAVEANYFGANLAAFMLAIFFIGLLSFGFRLEKTAYRYASVTLTIIVLIPRTNPAWIVALHRFIEVSVGIIVALAVVAIWPERSAIAARRADNCFQRDADAAALSVNVLKRGSFRSGSNIGSSRSSAGVSGTPDRAIVRY